MNGNNLFYLCTKWFQIDADSCHEANQSNDDMMI